MRQIHLERDANAQLTTKLEDQMIITKKTEYALQKLEELVSTKSMLIENLQALISQGKETQTSCSHGEPTQTNLTSEMAEDGMTSNCESRDKETKQENMVAREKLTEITEHYDSKIRMMEEDRGTLRANLEASDRELAKKVLEVKEMQEKLSTVNPPNENTTTSEADENAANKNTPDRFQASGVQECCEYIEVHAKNGAITNGLLLWADIQRKRLPANTWKAEAEKRFLKDEITEAKESLWRTAGDQLLGKMVNRKGASKISSEINDICDALKTLSENDKIPMFICTSSMVARTPIYQSNPDSTQETKRFDGIDQSLKKIIDMIHSNAKKSDTTQMSNEATVDRAGEINTALGDTIPVVDITGNDDLSSEQWTTVPQRNNNRRIGGLPPGQTGLVVSGVQLGTVGLQIAHYFANRADVDICKCELLTKRDDATFLTFKISVKNNDAGKLKDLAVLPEGWQIRPYHPPSAKKTTTRRKQAAPVNQSGAAGNAQHNAQPARTHCKSTTDENERNEQHNT